MKTKLSIFNFQLSTLLLALLFALSGCSDNDNLDNKAPESFTTRYRGTNMYTSTYVPEEDIDRLGGWNVNLVRWWLHWAIEDNAPWEVYRQGIVAQCERLDGSLDALRRNGIKVCLTMGTYPGGILPGHQNRMFFEIPRQDEFVQTWEYVAEHYKDEETVVMYDLMNEPYSANMPDMAGLLTKDELFLKTVRAIRALGDDTEIVYEGEAVEGALKWFTPFDEPGIIYSAHVYYPHALTHQALAADLTPTVSYPGVIGNSYWDSEKLRDHYRDVKRFADDNHVRIFVGEFGCVNWAPNNSAYHYLKDCIEFFEDEGWDYTYFGYTPKCTTNYGATAWSAQHDTLHYAGPCPLDRETDRLTLLKSFWAKNKE
ncbi:MAG: glycoside hydrolase family 5 protein [Prevotellaceae bacterium]|jgi:aryl-phospho-beta-D-glucosidase BglC (GH1 family)|nr:glycoside hydrolase family 5 protein [Prevotellaceae bacterium]